MPLGQGLSCTIPEALLFLKYQEFCACLGNNPKTSGVLKEVLNTDIWDIVVKELAQSEE